MINFLKNLIQKFTKKKKSELDFLQYSKKEKDEVTSYINTAFGEYSEIFHKPTAKYISIDVAVIPPTEQQDFYKLITVGMGAYKMNLPPDSPKNLEYAELVLYLPKNWNFNDTSYENRWPVRWLKRLAKRPLIQNTSISFGYTLMADEFIASNSKLKGFGILSAFNQLSHRAEITLENKKHINFYQVIPLYKEEIDFKNKTEDILQLLELFDSADMSFIVNLHRKNYCI